MERASRAAGALLTACFAAGLLGMSGCTPPPAITAKQAAEKKLPKRHPKVNDKQRQHCELCHRVVATPKGK